MTYKIKINYKTVYSYGRRNTSCFLELTWNDLEVAKKNLKRIIDHYKWYVDNQHNWITKEKLKEPEWHTGLDDNIIVLVADNENEIQMSAFWTDFFESLSSAEIEIDKENWKIEI